METYIQKSPTYFPYHSRSDNQKYANDQKYFRDCIEAGINILWWNQSSFTNIRASRREKIINSNLINGILDRAEMESVMNPLKLNGDFEFPSTYKNYPIINKNLEILFGEERKRNFIPVTTVVNEDVVNEKLETVQKEFDSWALQRLVADNFDKKQTEKELGDFNKWRLDYRTRHERMVQQLIDWGFETKFFKETFSRGFEDLEIQGEEIYITDILGGEPVLERIDPKFVHTLRSGTSQDIEDADAIIIDQFFPVGEVIDRYHEYLTDQDIQDLEEHHSVSKGGIVNSLYNYPVNFGESMLGQGFTAEGDPEDILYASRSLTSAFGGYYDAEGNVRVIRVLWRGMRKIGVLTYFDKDRNELKKFVPEQYKPNKDKGENVKWIWISEWYEGTKIGYDKYAKMQVLPFQSRHRDNPSICSPGIVGTAINLAGNKSKSIVSMAKQYQYAYNAYMYRLQHFLIKSVGKIGILPLHLLPADWPMDKIMYYATQLGWIPYDAFNEGNKGVATGKLAGSMQNVPTEIDMSFGAEIQTHIQMLELIKRECDELMGITPQRRGAVDNRETKGGVEIAVTQSSLSTERQFAIHNYTRIKALRAFVETCKIAWKGKSFTKQYVLDDGSLAVLDFDGDVFAETEYNISTNDNAEDQQMLQNLRSNIDRLLQNGTPLSIIMDLGRTKDPGVLQKKIEAWEQKKQEMDQQTQEQEMQKTQMELDQRKAEYDAKMQLEYEKLDREDLNKQLDREVDLQKAQIQALGFDVNKDENANNIPDVLEQGKLFLEQSKHSYETAFKNKELQLKEKEQKDNVDLKKKELKLREKDINTKLKIAKTNRNKYSK